jgi:hypothetical protein
LTDGLRGNILFTVVCAGENVFSRLVPVGIDGNKCDQNYFFFFNGGGLGGVGVYS